MDHNSHNNQRNQASTTHSRQREKRKQYDQGMIYGKIPPQARELEEAVLGAIMLEKGAFDVASEILKPESFYVDANQRIFSAMRNLSIKGANIDLLTVVEELKLKGDLEIVGGAYYVTRLTNTVVSSANIETHSRIILQKYVQREIGRIAGELVSDSFNETIDVFDLLEKAESALYDVSSSVYKKDFSLIGSGVPQLIERIEKLKDQNVSVTGITSGFKAMDKVTHGWQATDLVILAARPSVGKTAFALNLARNALMDPINPVNVGFFSLEMSLQQLLQRMMSALSGIWLERLRNGHIENTAPIYEAGNKIMGLKMLVDDTGGLNMYELRAKARRMVNKYGVGMIIIDYLQLMNGDDSRNTNREQEISKISRGLKKLAKELQIPIIALSQLSRDVEKRGKGQKVPQLSDIRESGAIEQDADMVIFLYKPSYDEIAEDAGLANRAMAKIAKHRNGSLEDFAFEVDNALQRWTEIGTIEKKQWVPVSGEPKTAIASSYNSDEMPF